MFTRREFLVASGFVGLSYEVQQLADATFFSAQNSRLIREFKALSSTGVLRLGGNTSEFAYWKPTLDSPEPEHPQVIKMLFGQAWLNGAIFHLR